MKRFALVPSLLLLAGLAACTGERPTVPEFIGVAREVLAFAEQDARQNQPGRVADGPLYVNVHSFRNAAERVTSEVVSEDSMSRALGEPTHALLEQVLLCDAESGIGGCWVRKFGVWVNLNLARHAGDEMTLFVRSTSTDRRRLPSDFCDRVWRIEYRRVEGEWRMDDRTLERDCRTET